MIAFLSRGVMMWWQVIFLILLVSVCCASTVWWLVQMYSPYNWSEVISVRDSEEGTFFHLKTGEIFLRDKVGGWVKINPRSVQNIRRSRALGDIYFRYASNRDELTRQIALFTHRVESIVGVEAVYIRNYTHLFYTGCDASDQRFIGLKVLLNERVVETTKEIVVHHFESLISDFQMMIVKDLGEIGAEYRKCSGEDRIVFLCGY